MGKDLKGEELGTGISQLRDGRYQARYTDRYGKRQALRNRSLSELKEDYNEVLRKEADVSGVGTKLTLDKWHAQWLDVYKYEVRDSTRTLYSMAYTKHISPVLGRRNLNAVNALDVRRLLNGMASAGYSFEVRNRVRIILLDMFDKAIMDDFAVKNPARGVKLKRDEAVERRVLSPEEQIDFFDACKGTFYDELFTVAVLTGLRPGELFALTWEDIDLTARTIRVNKTLLYQKLEGDMHKEYHLHPPKTEAGNRLVHFDERCAEALKSQFRKKSNVSLRVTAHPLPGLENLLFVTKYNTPLNSVVYNAAIQRIVDIINESRCELEWFESLSGHCFRHTYATRCFEAGVDPKVVQKQLGHATLRMTTDLYTHLLEDKKTEELSKLFTYMENVRESSGSLKEQRYQEALHPKVISL